MKSANWKREMVKAILEDFLIAIYQRSLEVVVEDTQITADTLPTIIEEYKDEAKSAYNYYLVLTSPEAEVITEDFNGLGKIELRVLIQPDLHRRVMMTRINGMKIFDQKNISASIQFAGICLLSDDHINGYFREMENPQHDAWEPERHSKPAEAKKNKVALARHIKEVMALSMESTRRHRSTPLTASLTKKSSPFRKLVMAGQQNVVITSSTI